MEHRTDTCSVPILSIHLKLCVYLLKQNVHCAVLFVLGALLWLDSRVAAEALLRFLIDVEVTKLLPNRV